MLINPPDTFFKHKAVKILYFFRNGFRLYAEGLHIVTAKTS